jgi:hypothetical protein
MIPRRFATLPRLALLVCAGLVMQLGWATVWTLSYRLTHGNDFTYVYLVSQNDVWEKLHDLLVLGNTLVPGLEGPEGPASLDVVVNTLVAGFLILGVGYLSALTLLDLGVAAGRGALAVVVLFEVMFQATLFLLPGLFTTDIFSYVMYGHISAFYELNPYIYPPNYFPGNEMLNWIHPIWHDQPSVYGPLWTDIGWLMAQASRRFLDLTLTMPDGQVLQVGIMDQVFAYKALMNGVQLVNLVLVWWLLGRFMSGRPRARLTAFALFAWNPLMLFDAAGNAHNDALMVTLLLLSVVPLALRGGRPTSLGWMLGTVCVALSALVKYTTLLTGAFYVVPWARQLPSWSARARWLGATGVVVAATTYVLFLPWLDIPRVFDPILTAAAGKSWMYSNWAPDLAALTIADQWLDPAGLNQDATHELVRSWAKVITRGIFLVYLGWEIARLWRLAGDRQRPMVVPVLEASVRAFTVLILLVLTWVLEWYWMWPLALATLLGWRRMLTKVVVGYTLTSLPIFYVHHYWSWHMPGGLVLVYALPPLTLPLVAWIWQRVRRDSPPELAVSPVLRPGLGVE